MKTEIIKKLNEIFEANGYLDDDVVDEDIIEELAYECQKDYPSPEKFDFSYEEYDESYSDDDFVYFEGLDFKNDVLSAIITDDCTFDINDFGDDLIEKIEDKSIEIYRDESLNSIEIPKFHVLNEYKNSFGETDYIVEFEMPDEDEVTYVARWDNRSPHILTESDFDYVEKILFYDEEEDEFYLAMKSYTPHPTMNCSCLCWTLDDLSSAYEIDWDEVYDEKLLEKFNS